MRESTKKQYSYYLKQFMTFHQESDLIIDANKLLVFLDSLYNRGLGYSAINTARSALSSVSSLLGKDKVGEDAIVCRFMKGIFNLRPTLPRYVCTWDPEVALKLLDVDSNNLSLLEFSRKVVFLVTLLSGQRVATIANLKLSDVSITETRISISVGLVKQSRPGYSQKPIQFNSFPEKPNVCVVNQLSLYCKNTKSSRTPDCQKLFLTSTRPIKPASNNTLSRWIKEILFKCNLSQFSSHSLRGSSTSAAHRAGFPIDSILNAAGWSNDSVFRKFYNRPVNNNVSLDTAILTSVYK